MAQAKKKQTRAGLTPERLELIVQLRRSGSGFAEIAEELGVDRTTIFRWRDENPELMQQLQRAQEDWENARLELAHQAAVSPRIDEETTDSEKGGRTTRTFDNVARSRLIAETEIKIVQLIRGQRQKIELSGAIEQKHEIPQGLLELQAALKRQNGDQGA